MIDVVFSAFIVRRRAVGARVKEVCVLVSYSFVMQMLYVCVLCSSWGSSQCCILHDLQFVNACGGCMRRPYGRGILQSQSHDYLIGSH